MSDKPITVTGIKLVDLELPTLAAPLSDSVVDHYRGMVRRGSVPPVRVRANRYGGRSVPVDETGRHIIEAARAEGHDFVLAIVED
jgi:hypothetical protein